MAVVGIMVVIIARVLLSWSYDLIMVILILIVILVAMEITTMAASIAVIAAFITMS